jgi:hypothetical protein
MEMEKRRNTLLLVALHSLIQIRIRYVMEHPKKTANGRIQIYIILNLHRIIASAQQEITCPEAVKLDDLDADAIARNYEAAKNAFTSAEAGSIVAAEAQIAVEVNKDMALALGIILV